VSSPDRRIRKLAFRAALIAILAVYVLAQRNLPPRQASPVAPELLVSLPRSAQVLMAAGDRNLAANLAGFRVLVADTQRMTPGDYAVQAKLQQDIAWLNPAHEDNYYIAAALLPWNGQLDAAQFVLREASDKRVFDYQPVFYYAFNYYHFLRDPATAAKLLLAAAGRPSDQGDQWALQNLAARWVERGYQTATAAGIVDAMAKDAPPGGFKKYLGMRAQRLRDLARLQELARVYRDRTGRDLRDLQELVGAGLIEAIPKDPIGFGYTLSATGEPMLKTTR
jgi:hypothetical protein